MEKPSPAYPELDSSMPELDQSVQGHKLLTSFFSSSQLNKLCHLNLRALSSATVISQPIGLHIPNTWH